MSSRHRVAWPYLLLLLVFISVIAWPVYILSTSTLAYASGDAWQLEAWSQVPKRVLLQQFLAGYQHSAIVALAAGIVAVLDYLLMSRLRMSTWLGGLLLPLTGIAIALIFLPSASGALPVLILTGVLLALAYRLLDLLAGRFFRTKAY